MYTVAESIHCTDHWGRGGGGGGGDTNIYIQSANTIPRESQELERVSNGGKK